MEEMLSWMAFSIQSRTVNTEIIEKIPIVIPKRERNVLNLLTKIELTANIKPSLKSLKNILQQLSEFVESSKILKAVTLVIRIDKKINANFCRRNFYYSVFDNQLF